MTTATKARPKDKPAVKRANLVEAMDGIFRPWFPLSHDGADTWSGWKAVLKAMDGLAMTADEIEFFKSVAGGREPPTRRVSELVAACARRTGKDSIASVVAAYGSATFDQQDRLRRGERAQVLCLACDRDHCWAAQRRHQDQRFHRRLPFRGPVLSLRKLRDVIAGIPQGEELAAAGQRDRLVERSFPGAISHWAIRKRPNDILLRLRWPS
jgi:hypothetical protein